MTMKPGSEYPPPPPPGLLLLRGGAPAAATHRGQLQPIPAPFMSFRPPTADVASTPMAAPHHQGQLRFHGHGGSSPFHQPPPGRNPNAADSGASTTHQRFTANSAAYRSAVGVYAPRRIWNPKSTLMTMFYNGAVNVFDVPMDKAQEIMVLASRASVSNLPRPTQIQKSDSQVPTNTTRFAMPDPRNTFANHVSVISNPTASVSQAPTLSRTTPGYQTYTPAPTTHSGVPPSVVPPVRIRASSAQPMQQASSVAVAEPIRPIAVRQSRKASLARFLEKRKDRVSSVMPYQLSKSQQGESSGSLGSASTPSRLSSADDATLSNNCQESMSTDTYNGTSLAMSRRVVIELE